MARNSTPEVVNGITYYFGKPPEGGGGTPANVSADTWHDRKAPRKGCMHCEGGESGGHYLCTNGEPCQDCVDEGLTAAENVTAGYGPNGEDTGSEYDPYDYY